MVEIIWSKRAVINLKKIYNYIAEDSEFYAEKTIAKIRFRTQILKQQIKIGKKVPEFNRENLRELIEGNYRIVYLITNENLVEIVTVVHSARNFMKNKK